jgi:hypothetical protein
MDDDHLWDIHKFDQASASLKPVAALLALYHKNLCESGFNRNEAISLVKQFQCILLKKAFNEHTPPEQN